MEGDTIRGVGTTEDLQRRFTGVSQLLYFAFSGPFELLVCSFFWRRKSKIFQKNVFCLFFS
jgi:hypothetical protein